MTAPVPRLGAMYDVGAALAIYWPDTHPCGPNRPEPWLILLPEGDMQWTAELREGARLLDYLPGFQPSDDLEPNSGHCNVCDEDVPSVELLDHLRVMHPDHYGDGPERWPDGGIVIHEPDAQPNDVKEQS